MQQQVLNFQIVKKLEAKGIDVTTLSEEKRNEAVKSAVNELYPGVSADAQIDPLFTVSVMTSVKPDKAVESAILVDNEEAPCDFIDPEWKTNGTCPSGWTLGYGTYEEYCFQQFDAGKFKDNPCREIGASRLRFVNATPYAIDDLFTTFNDYLDVDLTFEPRFWFDAYYRLANNATNETADWISMGSGAEFSDWSTQIYYGEGWTIYGPNSKSCLKVKFPSLNIHESYLVYP